MKRSVSVQEFHKTVKRLIKSSSYSMLAYEDPTAVHKKLAKHHHHHHSTTLLTDFDGLKNKAKELRKDAQAYMFYERQNKELVLAFRGTMNRDDFMDVIDIRHSKLDSGSILHNGFHSQFKSIEQHIQGHLEAAITQHPDITSVSFTGHSMGGGIAAIASSYFHKFIPEWIPIRCHVFGNPHFADASFGNQLYDELDELYCVHLSNDIIPYIPIHTKFAHLPNILQIKQNGAIPSCIINYDLSYGDFMTRLLNSKNIDNVYKYHSCLNYHHELMQLNHRLDTTHH